jgi:hypothetical protein
VIYDKRLGFISEEGACPIFLSNPLPLPLPLASLKHHVLLLGKRGDSGV